MFMTEGERSGEGLPEWGRRIAEALRPLSVAAGSTFKTIHALLLRESRTRYGRRSGGYVWALISPMILLVTMVVVFAAITRPAGAGDSMVVFFLTAILPVFLVRNVIARGGNAIRANRVLMHYPQVNAFEVITARTLLECLTYFIVLVLFALIMFAFFGLSFTAWIDQPLEARQDGLGRDLADHGGDDLDVGHGDAGAAVVRAEPCGGLSGLCD